MPKTDEIKQQSAGGIEISQSDLLQAASSMGPSVSDSERRRYQEMYVVIVLCTVTIAFSGPVTLLWCSSLCACV